MYNAAIQIDPSWDDVDRARAREMLTYKIAQATQTDIDRVRQRVTFHERVDFGEHKLLVATLPSDPPRVFWPVEHHDAS